MQGCNFVAIHTVFPPHQFNFIMQDIRYSVIIPTKNEAKYIGNTLKVWQALWDQYQLEVIVSDAGSRDGTSEVVEQWMLQYPDRIKWTQPEGRQNIAIGRNAGARLAQGDILFHTDADMRLADPAAFFAAAELVFAQPDQVAATAPIWVYPEEADWKDRLYHRMMNGIIHLTFKLKVFLGKGECQLVRRSAFEQIEGYDENLIAGEDCNLFFRLSQIGKLTFMRDQSVFHSPRRFRQMGYMKVSWVYLREGISLIFLGRSFVKEWVPTR
jgi:glycosyltransferase involved in cell wall biosynthesis